MTIRNLTHKAISRTPYRIVNRYYISRNLWRPEKWVQAPFYLIHIPKSAGSSIAKAMSLPDPGHLLLSEIPYDVQKIILRKKCLAIIRDPAQRLVSTFNYMHTSREKGVSNLLAGLSGLGDINEFLEINYRNNNLRYHYFLRPSSRYLNCAIDARVDLSIIEFGAFLQSAGSILTELSCKELTLPHEQNSSVRATNTSDISAVNLGRIRDIYSEDYNLIESYGAKG